MKDASLIAVSGQIATAKRITTLANNVANVNTTGFRATETKFSSVLDRIGNARSAFASDGAEYANVSQGGLVETGNSLDFAISGDAWFAIETPAGIAVTRDGRFQRQPDGTLVSLSGLPVLDPGGAPIVLAGDEPVFVSTDGFIRQDGRQVAALGLFDFNPSADFVRYGDAGILAGKLPEARLDDPSLTVSQGYLEQSNVDAVGQMVELISVQRAFEKSQSVLKAADETLSRVTRMLGGS